MSKGMDIHVKFYHDHTLNMICHVTLATNVEKFYFSPNSILNFRKVIKFGGNWLKNKKVTSKKQKSVGGQPPLLIGLINRTV